jgi:hypothetical protein
MRKSGHKAGVRGYPVGVMSGSGVGRNWRPKRKSHSGPDL